MHNMHAQHVHMAKRRKKVRWYYKQLSHRFRFKLHLAAMAFISIIQQINMYMYMSLTRTVVLLYEMIRTCTKNFRRT